MEGKRNWAYVQDPAPLSSISQTPSYQDFRTKNQLDIPSNGEKKIKMLKAILILVIVFFILACVALVILSVLFARKVEGKWKNMGNLPFNVFLSTNLNKIL